MWGNLRQALDSETSSPQATNPDCVLWCPGCCRRLSGGQRHGSVASDIEMSPVLLPRRVQLTEDLRGGGPVWANPVSPFNLPTWVLSHPPLLLVIPINVTSRIWWAVLKAGPVSLCFTCPFKDVWLKLNAPYNCFAVIHKLFFSWLFLENWWKKCGKSQYQWLGRKDRAGKQDWFIPWSLANGARVHFLSRRSWNGFKWRGWLLILLLRLLSQVNFFNLLNITWQRESFNVLRRYEDLEILATWF